MDRTSAAPLTPSVRAPHGSTHIDAPTDSVRTTSPSLRDALLRTRRTSQPPRLPTGLRRLSRGDLVAFAALVTLVIVLPALYVSAERVVYSSDYSGFQDAAVNTALELSLIHI